MSEDAAVDAYHRLHDAHALVLFPDTTDIWMANPFCFAPTVLGLVGEFWSFRA